MTYPVVNCIRSYAIGFVAESAEHGLDQLTRVLEENPGILCALVDDGSTPELPRLKTAVTMRKGRDVFERRITCCELHIAVNENETAEEVFARARELLARHGWSCDGGPA